MNLPDPLPRAIVAGVAAVFVATVLMLAFAEYKEYWSFQRDGMLYALPVFVSVMLWALPVGLYIEFRLVSPTAVAVLVVVLWIVTPHLTQYAELLSPIPLTPIWTTAMLGLAGLEYLVRESGIP